VAEAGRSHGRRLVIGVGNRDRGDDGIGLAVVEALGRRPDVDTAIAGGDLVDLAELWRGYDEVIVVDACITGRPVGSVVEVDVEELVTHGTLSTHGFDVGFAVRLARQLGALPCCLRVVGIEGRDASPGGLSPALVAQIDSIAGEVMPLAPEDPGPSPLA
jgi:hydrogenase maturation protease